MKSLPGLLLFLAAPRGVVSLGIRLTAVAMAGAVATSQIIKSRQPIRCEGDVQFNRVSSRIRLLELTLTSLTASLAIGPLAGIDGTAAAMVFATVIGGLALHTRNASIQRGEGRVSAPETLGFLALMAMNVIGLGATGWAVASEAAKFQGELGRVTTLLCWSGCSAAYAYGGPLTPM